MHLKNRKVRKKRFRNTIAISLHAVDDELRSELIPMNKAYNIASIIDAVKSISNRYKKKVMFEYLVIKIKWFSWCCKKF